MNQHHNILITRPLSEKQRSFAANLGLNVIEEPALTIEFRNNWQSVQAGLEKVNKPIFAFTSKNGVKGFDRFRKAGIELPADPLVYAVGAKTAGALEQIGLKATYPDQQNGVGLAKKIVQDLQEKPDVTEFEVLHFCGNRRREEFRHFLSESDIPVKDIVVYQTKLNQMNLPDKQVEAILFYSPSSVQAFRQSGGFRMENLPELVAIGSTTAQELSIESGKHVHISPKPSTKVLLNFTAQILNQN